VLLSIVARVACATVLLAAGVSAAVARGPLDEIMDTGFLHSWPEAEGQGPVAHSLRLRSGIRRHVDT
jgi:hypothetical protein